MLHDPLENDEMVCKDPTAIPKSMRASPQHCTTHEVEIYVSQACRKSDQSPESLEVITFKHLENILKESSEISTRQVFEQLADHG